MLEKNIIKLGSSVKEAIECIDNGNKKSVCIVDDDMRLVGIFTNGDMRKYLLKNGDLSKNIDEAMNSNPITFSSESEARKAMADNKLVAYPIIDENHILQDVLFAVNGTENDKISDALKNVPLVIMAGGKGTRLYPYTQVLPKALIPIGDVTISERIINNFTKYGCKKVYFILKHKAGMIRSYFNDIDKKYEVDYTEEEEFLGTGGGLKYLKGKINSTFFVSNCDVLVNADLECAYRTHKKNKNLITFICAMKDVTIPYGVISSDEQGNITGMKEKPEFSFLTNTGVYVIEPEVLEELNDKEAIHLPDIAKRCIAAHKKVGVFPISKKSWLDMGQFNEMERMMKELNIN